MQRVAVIATLKPDMAERARELVASGPPFDPDELGFERHHVYVSEVQVVFVFEGARVDALVRRLAEAGGGAHETFAAWEPLLQGLPELAHEAYFWERAPVAGSAAWGE
jgi:hypothetical protein